MKTSLVLFYALFTYNFLCIDGYSRPIITGTLKVTAKDVKGGQVISDARVCAIDEPRCSATNENGTCFIDSIKAGIQFFTVSAPGYDTLYSTAIEIKSGVPNVFIAQLRRSDLEELDKITVTGFSVNQKKNNQVNSVSHLSSFELTNTAGTANDINRILLTSPSVVGSVSGSYDNNIFVRGGHSSENVFVVDGIELDNISHFARISESGGKVGFISGSLVRELDFYTGAQPAYFPSRLSSVIDMQIREGDGDQRKQMIDLSMMGLSGSTEGYFNSKANYLAHVSIADLTLLEPFLDDIGGIPKFGNGLCKLTFHPSPGHQLSALGIFEYNSYSEENFWYLNLPFRSDSTVEKLNHYSENLSQLISSARWDYIGNKIQNSLIFSANRRALFSENRFVNYHNDTILQTLYADKVAFANDQRRTRYSIDNRTTFFVSDHLEAIGSGSIKYEDNYVLSSSSQNSPDCFKYIADSTTMEIRDTCIFVSPSSTDSGFGGFNAAVSAQVMYNASPIKLTIGTRGDYWSLIDDYCMSPRLGLSIDLNTFGLLSASAGQYYQFPSKFNEIFLDLLSRNYNRQYQLQDLYAQRCRQVVLGYELPFGQNHIATMELYSKRYDQEYPYVVPGNYFFNASIDSSGNSKIIRLGKPDGRKKAHGIEGQLVRKKYSGLYYALAGSFFEVKNRYTDGLWYRDENDLQYTMTLSVGSNHLKTHGFSLQLSASNGKPYSPEIITKNRFGTTVAIYDTTQKYYSKRFDPIYSGSIRYTNRSYYSWGTVIGYIDILNFLNYTPTVDRYFNGKKFVDITMSAIIPVGGISIEF